MNNNKEYFLNPGDAYVKKLNKEKEKNPNNYLGDAYLGDVATVSDAANNAEILSMLMVMLELWLMMKLLFKI